MKILFRPIAENKNVCYKVSIKNSSESLKQKESLLTYECIVTLKKETWNGYVVNFHRQNVLLNKSKSQEAIHEILLISGQVLYDLDLEITSEGKILHIKNWEQLQEKWKEIKFKIRATYKGEIVEKIISPMDQTLKNQETTISSLSKDPFFNSYLIGIYGEYKNGEIVFEGIHQWFLPKYRLSIMQKNEVFESELNEFHITSVSKVAQNNIDILEKQWKKEGEDSNVEVDLSIRYTLTQNKTIKKILVNNALFYNNHMIRNIEVNIQQQTAAAYE
ncbi:hypothetical protein LJC28_03110 [Dysgonomonas sp. OttesenSCG-928-D17]|nr:hypothetical protein [Dysgonomonas sp. OttesenSCG-928-D17]